MAEKISLDTNNIGLKELLEMSKQWDSLKIEELSLDKIGIVYLRKVMETREVLKEMGGGMAVEEIGDIDPGEALSCFMCVTGA